MEKTNSLSKQITYQLKQLKNICPIIWDSIQYSRYTHTPIGGFQIRTDEFSWTYYTQIIGSSSNNVTVVFII